MDRSEAGRALVAFAHTPRSASCQQCGAGFTAHAEAKFCSNRCRQAAKYQRIRATRTPRPVKQASPLQGAKS